MKILYLLIGAACIAGCSSPETPQVEANQDRIEDVLERIDITITDAGRAGQMRQIVTQLDIQLKAHETSLNAKRDAIIETSADYATTRQDLEAMYTEVSSETREMMGQIKAAHFAMKELSSPEEWKAVSGGRKQLIEFN